MMPDEKTPREIETLPDNAQNGEQMPVEATWEEDETAATGLLRALFVLVCSGLLLWAQWRAPESFDGPISQNWSRWVWTSVVFNFVLPLGILHLFFGQILAHQSWLKDQKHNAWTYGWRFADWKKHLKLSAIVWALSVPVLFYFSRDAGIRADYATYLPPVNTPLDWTVLLFSLVIYMFVWEWFFRGWMLFGLAQGLGVMAAIAIQGAAFGLAHWGKPDIEIIGSFAGGLILGALCWREKSFLPAFFIHALVHVTWAIFVKI